MTRGQISAEQLADVFRVTESEEGHRLVESDFGLPLLKNSDPPLLWDQSLS